MPADGSHFQAQPDRANALQASIRRAFSDTGRALPSDDLIGAAASALAVTGDLERTIRFHGPGIKQDASAAYPVLIAFQAALAEIAEPKLRVLRLRGEEAALRSDADYHLRVATEFDGKAIYQGEHGSQQLAVEYGARAAANHSLSAEKLAAAVVKSDEADDLSARLARTAELMMVVVPAQAQRVA